MSLLREVIGGHPFPHWAMLKRSLDQLKHSDQTRFHVTIEALGWVINARRPLSVSELADALRCELSRAKIEPKSGWLEELCQYAVVADQQGDVHIHGTLKGYLLAI